MFPALRASGRRTKKVAYGVRRSLRKQPAPRVPPDSRAFLVEEKFDTWLDLGSMKKFQLACKGKQYWLSSWMRPWNKLVGAESVVMLHRSQIEPDQVYRAVLSPGINAKILDHALRRPPSSCHLDPAVARSCRHVAQDAARMSVEMQVNHMTQNISSNILDHSRDSYAASIEKMRMLPPEVVGLQLLVEDWMNVLDIYKSIQEYVPENNLINRVKARMEKTSNVVKIPSIEASITLSIDLSLLEFKGKTYLVPHDLLLELVNKASELYVYLLYSYLQDGVSMPKGHYRHAVEFMAFCLNQVTRLCRYGAGDSPLEPDNRGFAVLKSMEGLGVAWMIWKGDQDMGWWNDTLLNNLWTALYLEKLVPQKNFAESALHSIFTKMTVPQIADLIGCVKIAGHPSIEVERGLRKLYDRTHNEIEVDFESVTAGIGVLTRDICKQFYLRFKRYPILDQIPDSDRDILRRTLQNNLAPTHPIGRQAFTNVPALVWADVLFGKNAEFDPIDNQLVLLKDKALGLERNKIWPILMERITEKEQLMAMRAENRRALLSFILHPHFSNEFQDYMYHYEHDDPWRSTVLNYLVIKLTPKEKEMKGEGRFYGASPMPERNRRVTQEENTMRFMQSLIPDQLMTQDELSTIRKLYSFRYYQEMYPDHQIFQVSFDFSKWNNNMRHDSVDRAAAQILDRWFGKNLWGKTMRAYEEALIYYTDHTRKTHWEGQFGGIEGLNQATWSFVFLGGVKHALEQIGVIYQVTVKGDDVRAAIAIGNDYAQQRGHEGVRQDILMNLQRLCAAMGWELNPNETFVSLSLISTSKQYQFKNSWLPASSKKMVKAMSLANLLFPTHEDIISSIFSCAHSACAQATCIIPAFQCASIIAAGEIRRFLGHRMEPRKISQELIAMMLMWPQVLGGPGALPLQTFFVRGENDMLAVSLSLLRYISFTGSDRLLAMALAIGQLPFSDPPHYPLLLSDPYSLCLDIPERASSLLKRIMRKHLTRVARNEHLVRLLGIKAQQDREMLVEALCSMMPYCAKVATVLWECSPFYVIEEVLAKFLQSQTVFKFLSTGRNQKQQTRLAYKHLTSVMRAAIKREKFWITTLLTTKAEMTHFLGVPMNVWIHPGTCTTQITHMVREACWKKPIIGITYPSLVDQLALYSAEDIARLWGHVDMGQVYAEVCILHKHATFQTDFKSHHYSSASGSIPWIGASTSTNYHFVQGMTRVTSAALSKILKLVALRLSGNYLGRDFTHMVDLLIRGLTGTDLGVVTVLQPELGGGHIPHRVACNSYSLTTMPNFRPNIMQLVRVNKEAHAILRGDTRDRTINYAAKHYMGIVYATLPLQFAPLIPDQYPEVTYMVFHHNVEAYPDYELCQWCCHVIDDEPVTFQIPPDLDLSAYQRIPLVGTSDYDEHILQINLDETLRGKGIDWAAAEELDVNDPIVLTCATRVVMTRFSKAAQQAFMAARAQGYLRVPKGDLCQFLAASNMVSSIQTVSMNMLRAMPDQGFYEAVMSEVLDIICSMLLSTPENALLYIDRLQPHLNPVEGLFSAIKNAGLLPKLADGANLEAVQTQYAPHYLEWRAGDPQDGHSASVTFMRHIAGKILAWLGRTGRPVKWIIFVHYESRETAVEAVEAKYHTIMKIIVLRILGGIGHHSKLRAWRQWVDQTLAEFTQQEEVRLTEERAVDMAFRTALIRRYMRGIDGGHDWARDVLVSLMLAYRAYEWLGLDQGAVDHLMQGQHLSEDVHLISIMEAGALAWEPMRFQNLPALAALEPAMGLQYWRLWCDVMIAMHELEPDETDRIVDLMYQRMEEIGTFLDNNVTVKIAFLNLADAERIIRNRFLDPEEAIMADQLYYRITPPQLPEGGEFQHVCEIRSDNAHNLHARVGAPALVHRLQYAVPDLDPFPGSFLYEEDPTDHIHCYVDPLEPARVGGHLNTAITKYATMFRLTGALRLCQDLGEHAVIVCAADGIGALAVYCASMCQQAQVIYNSLLETPDQVDGVRDASVYGPPAEICSTWGRPYVKRIRREGFFPGDLTMGEVCKAISNTIGALGQLTLLTCDADINWKLGLRHHMRLLWNITQLVASHLHPQGVAIIKMFLLADPEMTRWVHFCATFFQHFHLFRCVQSRAHSLEMFVIIGGFRGGRLTELQWAHLMEGVLAPQLHVEARNYVAHVYTSVSRNLRLYHETGIVPSAYPVRNVWEVFMQCMLPPLNIHHLLDIHCSLSAERNLHLCTMMDQIIQALINRCTATYQVLFNRYYTPRGVRRQHVQLRMGQPHRSAVAVGHRLTFTDLSQLYDLMILAETLSCMQQMVPYRQPVDFYGVHRYALDRLHEGFEAIGEDLVIAPDDNHHTIITLRAERLDTTDRARRMMNKALRVWGSHQYALFIAGSNSEWRDIGLHFWGTGITCDRCCRRFYNNQPQSYFDLLAGSRACRLNLAWQDVPYRVGIELENRVPWVSRWFPWRAAAAEPLQLDPDVAEDGDWEDVD